VVRELPTAFYTVVVRLRSLPLCKKLWTTPAIFPLSAPLLAHFLGWAGEVAARGSSFNPCGAGSVALQPCATYARFSVVHAHGLHTPHAPRPNPSPKKPVGTASGFAGAKKSLLFCSAWKKAQSLLLSLLEKILDFYLTIVFYEIPLRSIFHRTSHIFTKVI